jgi:hypothetical protein
MPDALELIHQDHQEVKDLFKRFESTDDKREKQRIAESAIVDLVVHSMIEEEIFYPAVRKALAAQGEDVEMMVEAEEEHHVVDLLIEELTNSRTADEHFDAKFKVMAENVKHHMQEEESMMLPKAAELGIDSLNRLGDEMYQRKTELMQEFQGGGRIRRRTAAGRGASRNGRAGAGRRRTTRTTRTTARRGVSRGRTTTARGGTTRGGTRTRATARRTTSASSRRTSTGRTSTRSRTTAGTRASSRSRGTRATAGRTSRSRSR